MEVSTLKYHGGLGLHARSPLLRLQTDERLVAFVRRGNVGAFEVLVSRYESRLLAFCRHLLGSREDAEDVLQEVFAAAFNALLADDRPIKVRPWLYRIARNRSLNHLRRNTAIGVDSMDIHYSDNGASTADKAHEREEFRMLVGDIHDLPETQRTALVLREMDALSYEQIADAMETTIPSVKSLLVRARVSLAEAAEARQLSCDQVRLELGEVAEGLKRRPSPLVRRHLRTCERCSTFRVQLRETNKALAALLPFGPLVVFKKLALTHLGHSAGSSAAGSSAAGGSAAAGGTAAGFAGAGGAGGLISAGMGAVATKAVAGLAAAALVTAGAVEVGRSGNHRLHHQSYQAATSLPVSSPTTANRHVAGRHPFLPAPAVQTHTKSAKHHEKASASGKTLLASTGLASGKDAKPVTTKVATTKTSTTTTAPTTTPTPGRTVTTTSPTHLPTSTGPCGAGGVAANGSGLAGGGGSDGNQCDTTPITISTDTTTTPATPTTPPSPPTTPPSPPTITSPPPSGSGTPGAPGSLGTPGGPGSSGTPGAPGTPGSSGTPGTGASATPQQ